MPTNSDHATLDMAGLYASMQREIASLRASQIAANREITYLRRNQDRVVREIGSEMRHMRRGVKVMQNQLQEREESQRMLLSRVQQSEANASASGSGSAPMPPTISRAPIPSQNRHRRLELRRQGAFRGEDINNLPWDELNDVRGFNPNMPRYHWSATSPPMHTHNAHTGSKRTRDDVGASAALFDQIRPSRHGEVDSDSDSEDNPSPHKRRRVSSGARVARMTVTKTPPAQQSVFSRPADSKHNTARRSTSFLSGVIAGVSSVFLSS